MEKKHLFRKIFSGILAISMLSVCIAPANAERNRDISVRKIDNSAVTASPLPNPVEPIEDETPYSDRDTVRVSIILSRQSTISAGFELENIGANSSAMAYRDSVKREQQAVTARIQKATGSKLDVVWNLSLAADLISANVPYGQIETIRKVSGVQDVVIESAYYPQISSIDRENTPKMATSPKQIGSAAAWNAGYTGAGTRIAVIDTGIDLNHISFNPAAYEYALEQIALEKGVDSQEYVDSLDLLDAQKIRLLSSQLNARIAVSEAYKSGKIPFGYDYVASDSDISHDNMTFNGGEHGSHVAGISAANTYVPAGKGEFADALSTVHVRGVAPEAQILVMKVFNSSGSTYDSDYMAAVEDAILLGADSINLSLGSSNPGFAECKHYYQKILNELSQSGAVMCIAAGNAGGWADYADPTGYLYADDVSMQTAGTPGTYRESLCVASADNDGTVGSFIRVGDYVALYTEDLYSNEPLFTAAGEQDYVLINGYGSAEDFQAIAGGIQGKIILCSRGGDLSFSQRAENAASAGASGLIFYNNQPGNFGTELSDYSGTMPVAVITMHDMLEIQSRSEKTGDYFTGKMTVGGSDEPTQLNSPYYTMSTFSSWGVPGTLEMKPEITAPGGKILSVWGTNPNGGGTNKYELMSGTSMATPQVSGMAALVAQYLRENNLCRNNVELRHMAQSLLMSTAVPMKCNTENGESYYSILQQGAGLANVGLAVSADSYLTVGDNATASWADGKVKAEFGDDPDRTGHYEFTFTIHNISQQEKNYTLSADFFRQGILSLDGDNDGTAEAYMDKNTVSFDDEKITWSAGNTVAVAAGEAKEITVKIDLSDACKRDLNKKFPNGTYIQGFVYAESEASPEGVAGTVHSIPCLGFYGSWSEPSMFENGSYVEYLHNAETKLPYTRTPEGNKFLIRYAWDPDQLYNFGGNPIVPDDEYLLNRNAINLENGDRISEIHFTLIRNAIDTKFEINDITTDDFISSTLCGPQYCAFSDYGMWEFTSQSVRPAFFVGNDIPEGENLSFTFCAAAEYYQDAQGNIDWDRVDFGGNFTTEAIVDNTAPVLYPDEITIDREAKVLKVPASDNQYVAAVAIYDETGETLLSKEGAKQQIKCGEKATYDIDLRSVMGRQFLVQVYDYAMNTATYEISLEMEGITEIPEMLAFDSDGDFWISFDKETAPLEDPYGSMNTHFDSYLRSPYRISAATIAENVLYALDEKTNLYAAPVGCLYDFRLVGHLGTELCDLAYNPTDGEIYGLTYTSEVVTVNKATGEMALCGRIPFDANNIACDLDGIFYTNEYYSGKVFQFEKKDLLPIEAAGSVHSAGSRDQIRAGEAPAPGSEEQDYGNFKLIAEIILPDGQAFISTYRQAMEINPNTGMLCWTSGCHAEDMMSDYAYYIEIDPATGEYTLYHDMIDHLCALVIPNHADAGKKPPVTDFISSVTLSRTSLSLLRGNSAKLDCFIAPWTTPNHDVIWTTEDETIATVDPDGVVTAVREGLTDITVTSRQDPSKKGTCTVYVQKLTDSIHGVLADKEQGMLFYDWDLSRQGTWQSAGSVDGYVLNAAYDPNHNLTYGADVSYVYQFDEDGKIIQSAPIGLSVPIWDMAYNATNDTISTIHETSLFVNQDPLNMNENAIKLDEYCNKYFIAIADLGPDKYEMVDQVYDCEHLVLLDNAGYLLHVYNCGYDESGSPIVYPEDPVPSDLPGDFQSVDGNVYCSMVAGEYGELYLSYFNGKSNDLYKLNYNSNDRRYETQFVSNFGAGIYPAAITQVTSNPEIPSDRFIDVGGNYMRDSIDFMVSKHYMNGTSVDMFEPYSPLNRGEMITILYRMAGSPDVSGTVPFTDVSKDAFYYPALVWAVEKGVTVGRGDGTFGPYDDIRRQDLTVFLYRCHKLNSDAPAPDGALNSYEDYKIISPYAVDAMNWAVRNGIVQGVEPTILNPRGHVIRGDAAVMAERYCKLVN